MGSFLSLDPERRRSSSGDYYDEYFFIQKLHFLKRRWQLARALTKPRGIRRIEVSHYFFSIDRDH